MTDLARFDQEQELLRDTLAQLRQFGLVLVLHLGNSNRNHNRLQYAQTARGIPLPIENRRLSILDLSHPSFLVFVDPMMRGFHWSYSRNFVHCGSKLTLSYVFKIRATGIYQKDKLA